MPRKMTIDPQPSPVSKPLPIVESVVESVVAAPKLNGSQSPENVTKIVPAHIHNNGLVNELPPPVAIGRPLIAPTPLHVPAVDAIYSSPSGQVFANGSPEWQAAREKVMAIVGSSTPTSFPSVVGASANGVSTPTESFSQPPGQANEVTDGISTPAKRGTGRPRGRPRGSRGRPRGSRAGDTAARGSSRSHVKSSGKRKRGSDDDGADDTEDSENFTPVATVTKSGRNITKPPQYNPAPVESTDGDTPRKKRRYKKGSEMALCVKCQRGHSTVSNMVVFCDGCNDAFHQWCHDPLIGRDVIDIPEREWFCYICQGRRERDSLPHDQRVSGQSLSEDEKARYIRSLSSVTLADLLIRAVALHPDLPIFAPSAVRNPTPKRLKLTMTPSLSTSTPTVNASSTPSHSMSHPQANGHETSPNSSTSKSQEGTRPMAPPTQPSHVAFQPPQTLSARPSSPSAQPKSDPYPDYSNPYNDPPATYPRPGRGPIKLRSITSRDDMQILLDENFDVFSHLCSDGNGNLVPLKGSGSRAKGSSEIVRLGDAKTPNAAGSTASTTPAYPALAPALPPEPPVADVPKSTMPPVTVPPVPKIAPAPPKQRPLAPAPPRPSTATAAGTVALMAAVSAPKQNLAEKPVSGVTTKGDEEHSAQH